MTSPNTFVIEPRLSDDDIERIAEAVARRQGTGNSKLAVRGPEAAAMLSMSVDKLKDLAYRGTVPSFVVDGMRFYPVDGLTRWVAACVESDADKAA